MNIRQQKYKANRLIGMSMYNAARSAGYSHAYSTQAHRIERLVKVSIQDALERAGLTERYQAEQLAKLSRATRPISCNVYVKAGEDGNYEMLKNADGLTKDFIEVDDNNIRLRTLEHIADLKKQKTALIDQSTHITYAYIRNTKASEEERSSPRTPIQTR